MVVIPRQGKEKVKQLFRTSKESYKKALKGIGPTLYNTIKGTKNLVDGVDESIGAKIGPKKNKIINTARRYLLRTLIAASVAGYVAKESRQVYDYVGGKVEESEYKNELKQEGFVTQNRTFSQGGKKWEEFTYTVKKEDIQKAKEENINIATIIADKFDEQDHKHGDKYQNTGYNNVYDRNNIMGLNLVAQEGEVVFLKASKKEKKSEKFPETKEKEKINLRKKPIDLGYKKIYPEKAMSLKNFPNIRVAYDYDGRVIRSLRRKPITDAVEDRYGIPRGLLMAMMAQEGYGDPTLPNDLGDGGLGLIHIQAVNANDYGMKTLPTYTREMRDMKHGEKIKEVLKEYGTDTKKLIKYDDRFHPIMAVDVAARYLKNYCYKPEKGKDAWVYALKRYSGRGLSDYAYPVLQYWATINDYTGESIPDFTKGINDVISGKESVVWRGGKASINTKNMIAKTRKSLGKMSVKFEGETEEKGCEAYIDYFNKQCENYGLEEYKALGQDK